MNEPNSGAPDPGGAAHTDSSNSVLVEIAGPEDTTRRPLRPGIPPKWTRPDERRPLNDEPPAAPPSS